MKKITIIAFMLAASVSAFAQTDSKTVKQPEPKPQYQTKASAPVNLSVTLTFGQVNAYYVYAANPSAIEQSKTMVGEQISAYRENYKFVQGKIDSALTGAFKKTYEDGLIKFKADTTAKYHPGTKPIK